MKNDALKGDIQTKFTTILVDKNNWKKIMNMKFQGGFISANEVITSLLFANRGKEKW